MDTLNYHHLRYFREVAHEGNLTRAAQRVNLSQSALSMQIKTLEHRLGQKLFDRVGRQLILTEVGRIALDHADRIFSTGAELMSVLDGAPSEVPPLRVGALSTLSRNFQLQFLKPVLASNKIALKLISGSADVLFEQLRSLSLDVLLTTEPPHSAYGSDMTAHRLAEQTVALHGTAARVSHPDLNTLLASEPLIVPTDTGIRRGFDSLVARLCITPNIVADVDDMAMVRLLARADAGVAVAPDVVLTDEIASGRIRTAAFPLDIAESFYAVTVNRNFPHPILTELLSLAK